MLQREFILAVQRFRDGAGLRGKDTQTVAGKVRTVGRVDTDRGGSPPLWHKKSAPKDAYVHIQTETYRTITSVPAAIKTQPIKDLAVNLSCRNTKAKINVITTLNLSIGTTFDASPSCKAL